MQLAKNKKQIAKSKKQKKSRLVTGIFTFISPAQDPELSLLFSF
jgi:hypothetical protein